MAAEKDTYTTLEDIIEEIRDIYNDIVYGNDAQVLLDILRDFTERLDTLTDEIEDDLDCGVFVEGSDPEDDEDAIPCYPEEEDVTFDLDEGGAEVPGCGWDNECPCDPSDPFDATFSGLPLDNIRSKYTYNSDGSYTVEQTAFYSKED